MQLDTLIVFAVAHLIAAASPGPNFFLVSTLSARRSRRAGRMAAFGICLSVVVWSSASAAGLNLFLESFPALFQLIKLAGALYLVWLGLRMILSGIGPRGVQTPASAQPAGSGLTAVRDGFLVNMGNPKTLAYYTSVFAVLVPQEASSAAFFDIVLTAVIVSSAWWCAVAFLFSTRPFRTALQKLRRFLDVIAGGAFVFFGLRLALQEK